MENSVLHKCFINSQQMFTPLSEITSQSAWQKSGLLTFVPLLLLSFFFTEGGRGELQVVHVVPSNQHLFLKLLCVHALSSCNHCSSCSAEIQFSMLWLSEETLTLCMS